MVRTRIGYLVLVALIVAIYFAPCLLFIGWQVVHRGRLSEQGLIVNVPWGWLPAPKGWRDKPEVELIKIPRTVLSKHARGIMSFGRERLPTVVDEASLQHWRDVFASIHSARDYDVEGPFMAGGEAHCMVARPRSESKAARVDCYLRRGEFTASFNGLASDIDVFIRTVSVLKY